MAKLRTSTNGLNLFNLTYNDLKRECLKRGMGFQEVVSGDVLRLNHWLNRNINNKQNPQLIQDYDNWIEEVLISRGQEQLVHDSLRLAPLSWGKETETKKEKPKTEDKPKVRREKTVNGLYAGTKKALVYELVTKDRSIEKVIKRVQKYFPDAKEKSIKIWYNKAKREIDAKGKSK